MLFFHMYINDTQNMHIDIYIYIIYTYLDTLAAIFLNTSFIEDQGELSIDYFSIRYFIHIYIILKTLLDYVFYKILVLN